MRRLHTASAGRARQVLWLLALVSSAHMARADQGAGAPTAEDDKTLYALGVLISHNLATFDLSGEEFKMVQSGLADGFNHRASIDPDEYEPKVHTLQRERLGRIAERQKAAGQAFLQKAAALPGAQQTATGLVYIPLSVGEGASPQRGDRVSVHYEGKLIDGTVFDSSAKHGGQPVSFNVGGVIPCWSEALQLMKVGGKSRVICPSSLAYGDRGAMPAILPGATLDFSIELLDIPPRPPSPAATPGESGAGDTAR